MPAFYTHHRFGAKVAERLKRESEELGELIRKYPEQYAIGQQGPDIFFFYRPYYKNRAARYGSRLHHESALAFMERARRVVRKKGRDSREYAYLLGFIGHFVLDSECHPYVAEWIEAANVQHFEIEEEFEKMMLRLDHKDPLAYPISALIPSDDAVIQAMLPFYKGMNAGVIQNALEDMKRVKALFTAPGFLKQGLINTVMRMTGRYAQIKGLMNQRKDNPKCLKSNEELLRRFDHAVDVAAELILDFDRSVRTGAALNARFERNFE